MRVVIAAAGTGGHVYPALAVGHALVDQGVERGDITVFGGDRMAGPAATEAGFGFSAFRLARLRRSLAPSNLAIPPVVWRAARAMAARLDSLGAAVVLGMSGYVTVPASIAARRRRLPFFVQEQNALPGLAARFAARRALATFIGLPGPASRLPRSVVTGNPLRPEIATFDRKALKDAALRRYDLPSGSAVLGILGGSLGARVLNEAVPAVIEALAGRDVAVVHLSGAAAAGAASKVEGSSLPLRRLPFEPEMQFFYASCDLVVARAGAMTVSELAATATPAVLVPLKRVGQQHNAAVLGSSGAAVTVDESEMSRLPLVVSGLIDNTERREMMARRGSGAGGTDAAQVIARRLLEAARG